jgi:cell division protein FtsW (lipid II flippase)
MEAREIPARARDPERAYAFAPLVLAITLGVLGVMALDHLYLRGVRHQPLYLALGLALALPVAFRLRTPSLVRAGYELYVMVLLLMVAAVARGHDGFDARWLPLGHGIRVRVAEPMALALVLALARTSGAPAPRWLAPLIVLAPCLVALAGRDFASIATFLVIAAAVLIAEGRAWLVLGAGACAIACAPVFWRVLHGYQRQRIAQFFGPSDPHGVGWMPAQVRAMVRGGGFSGAASPYEASRSFGDAEVAFPVLARHWGFVGAFLALALFAALIVFALRTASCARSRGGALVALGVAAWLAWKTAVGLAIALGVAPIVAISMPMLGAGGTNVVATLVATGVLAAIARDAPDAREAHEGAPESAPIAGDPLMPSLLRHADALALGVTIVAALIAARLFVLQVA